MKYMLLTLLALALAPTTQAMLARARCARQPQIPSAVKQSRQLPTHVTPQRSYKRVMFIRPDYPKTSGCWGQLGRS